jgi:hypothetical protein
MRHSFPLNHDNHKKLNIVGSVINITQVSIYCSLAGQRTAVIASTKRSSTVETSNPKGHRLRKMFHCPIIVLEPHGIITR